MTTWACIWEIEVYHVVHFIFLMFVWWCWPDGWRRLSFGGECGGFGHDTLRPSGRWPLRTTTNRQQVSEHSSPRLWRWFPSAACSKTTGKQREGVRKGRFPSPCSLCCPRSCLMSQIYLLDQLEDGIITQSSDRRYLHLNKSSWHKACQDNTHAFTEESVQTSKTQALRFNYLKSSTKYLQT